MPRTATEAVLVRLEMALREGERWLLLRGPDGAGKTLLMHVLAQRLDGDFHAVHLPYPKLSPAEFCKWTLAALGGSPARRPEAALHDRITRDIAAGFPPLLLMVDDAESMPGETLRCLRHLQDDTAGFLHVLLVCSEGGAVDAAARGDGDALEIALEGSMGPDEVARYVKKRLDRAWVEATLRERFEAAIEQLQVRSGGNPARLHAVAAEIQCRPPGFLRHPTPPGGNSPQ